MASTASQNNNKSVIIFQSIITFFKEILATKAQDTAAIAALSEQLEAKTLELSQAQAEGEADAVVSGDLLAQVRELAAELGLATPAPVDVEVPVDVTAPVADDEDDEDDEDEA